MNITTLSKVRSSCTTTYNKLAAQLARGMYLDNDQVDEWSTAVAIAERYQLTDLYRQLTTLLAKPRSDAGRSISKPGTERKRQATDAFHALFVGGLPCP